MNLISESQRELWQRLEQNENQFFALHRSERVDWPDAVLLASPYPEVQIWNFTGSITTSYEHIHEFISNAEAFFMERAMAPSFKTNPLTMPSRLSQALEDRGYAVATQATTMLYGGALRIFVKSNKTHVERIGLDKIEQFTITQLDGFESSHEWLPWFLETNQHNVQRPDHVYYIAYIDDTPAGVMLSLTEPKEVCGIYAVATLPQFRGQGIATELFAHVIADGERAGCEWITLSTATGGPAEKYFTKLGFNNAYVSQYYVKNQS